MSRAWVGLDASRDGPSGGLVGKLSLSIGVSLAVGAVVVRHLAAQQEERVIADDGELSARPQQPARQQRLVRPMLRGRFRQRRLRR